MHNVESKKLIEDFFSDESNLKEISSAKIARLNLFRCPGRSFTLFSLTFLFAMVLLFSAYLSHSIKNGISSINNRLGADIILVPAGYDAKIKSAILRGEPADVYFSDSILEQLNTFDEVEQYSPELYVQTLSAGCCSYPIQLIGFDSKSSFTVQAWLKNKIKENLADDEIVVGHNISAEVGTSLRFFAQNFKVIGKMDKTGTEFDNSVFMSIDVARSLLRSDIMKRVQVDKNIDFDFDKDKALSTVLIKLKENSDISLVNDKLREQFKDQKIYPLVASTLLQETRSKYSLINIFFLINSFVFALILFVCTYIIYSGILRERKLEISSLRIIAAKDKFIRRIFITEALIISIVSSVVSSIFTLLLIVILNSYLRDLLALPWLDPNFTSLLIWIIAIIIFTSVISILAIWINCKSFEKKEISELINSES